MGRIDLVSVALSLAAILPIVYGFKELAKNGLLPLPIAAIVAGLAVSVIFLRRERTLDDPILDLGLFTSRAFSAAVGAMLFGTMLMGAIMLFVTQYLQLVEGLSPLRAGMWMLPAVAAQTFIFLLVPLIARRIRPAYIMGVGLAVSLTGLILLTQLDATSGTRA
jgi:DHA2 family multidrug resistance protein-like MFS transporter